MSEPGRKRLITALLLILCAATGTVYLLAVLNAVPAHPDLDIYVEGARSLAQGHPLYRASVAGAGQDPTLVHGFIYPPVFAIALAPLLLLPASAVPVAWLLIMHLALAAAFIVTMRRIHPSRSTVLLAILATLAFYPLWVDSSQGQANLLILLLVVLGLSGVSAESAAAGGAFGAAAALKLVPGLLCGWLIWERRFRAAAWLLGVALAMTLLGFLLMPSDTLTYVRDVLPALGHGTAYPSNQSLSGVIDRLLTVNPYTTPLVVFPLAPMLVAIADLALIAWWAHATRGEPSLWRRGLSALPLLPLLSTVSWEHHLVILLPLIWVAIASLPAPVRLSPRVILLAISLLCLLAIPHLPIGPPYGSAFAAAAHTHNPISLALANRLTLGTLLLAVAGPSLVRQPVG